MLVEALLVSLIVSIGFFFYEFYKIRFVFEDTFRYNQFFTGFGLTKIRMNDATERVEHETMSEISNLKGRFAGIEDRMLNQENVVEKLIREISEVNG